MKVRGLFYIVITKSMQFHFKLNKVKCWLVAVVSYAQNKGKQRRHSGDFNIKTRFVCCVFLVFFGFVSGEVVIVLIVGMPVFVSHTIGGRGYITPLAIGIVAVSFGVEGGDREKRILTRT